MLYQHDRDTVTLPGAAPLTVKKGRSLRLPARHRVERPEDAPERPWQDRPKVRKCLRCAARFSSEGWHNRLCRPCTDRAAREGNSLAD